MEVLNAYVAEFGQPPTNPQQLMQYSKKRTDLPSVNFTEAKRLISQAPEAQPKNAPSKPPVSSSNPPPKLPQTSPISTSKPLSTSPVSNPPSKPPPSDPPARKAPPAPGRPSGKQGGDSSQNLKKSLPPSPSKKLPPSNNPQKPKTYNSESSSDGVDLSKFAPRAKGLEFKKKLVLSKAARAAGRNEEAIKVNLNSVRSKPKFGRMIIYNINCLANLAENRFNCEFIVELGGIELIREVMKHHKSSPAVMKEMARLIKNMAKASPEFCDKLAESGLLDECLDMLKTNPNECGAYALDIIDSCLKYSSNPKKVADALVKKGILDVLQNCLAKNITNSELAGSLVETLNLLAKTQPEIARAIGEKKIYRNVLDAMKMHPNNAKLAVNGCDLLALIARLDPKYLKDMQQLDAVGIISRAMQANPDLLSLLESGAAALKVLAGEDDLTKALNILFNYDQYDNKVITEALGLLGNLALITENAQYFAAKGGVNALLDLVQYKCKQHDMSPEDLALVANAIRALGRLLGDPKTATEFGKANGMDQLKNLVERFGDEEGVMNAVMDALENLAKTKTGQKLILDSGILPVVTKVMANNPDYDVLFRKYAGLVGYMPLDNKDLVAELVDAGLLKAITGTLLAKHDDKDAVIAACDMIKDLVTLHPHLAQQLARDNAQPLLQALQDHSHDPEVLTHLFGAIKALASADPATLDEFKKLGLEDELNKILKQDTVSVEVQQLVQDLLDALLHNNMGNLDELKNLSALDYQPDGVNIEEKEIKDTQDRTDDMMDELKKLASLLDDPDYAAKYIQEGKVSQILDAIQNYYDNPKIVAAGLEDLLKCALVNGAFLQLEQAGVPEAVIQCMMEHPDDLQVQLAGLKLLAALAQHSDPAVTDVLCQPLALETALKAVQGNVKNAEFMGAFADYINGLLKDDKTAPQIVQALQNEGIPDFLRKGLEYHKMNMAVAPKIQQALKTIDQLLYNPDIGKMSGDVKPYGTMTMAQLANMDPEQLMKVMSEWDAEELLNTVKGAKNPKLVQSGANEVNRRLNGDDAEFSSSLVNNGGIEDLLNQAQANLDNGGPLGACLDALGTLSTDDKLKTLLGMHGLVRLILETIRAHPMDIELLDKCCYILSNLTFNNADNMTQVIELGGVADIEGVLKRHKVVNFLCESALNVLVNLCHNSDKNKILICRSGGAKVTIDCLRQFNRCTNEGDEPVVVSAFRCLANLAFVPDNVKQLIKLDAVALVMDTMQKNTDHRSLIQMGVVVLANLSSHEKVAHIMVQLGVLDLILAVSKGYPDEIEIQKSCLGCVGNLMNEASNAVAFLDKKGHLRIYEIMKELVFEESVTSLCCKLLKVLATNSDIAHNLTESGGCRAVAQLLEDNRNQTGLVALGCQALCKMIATEESSKIIAREGIVALMVDISSENDNWANLEIMNEVIKVVVNFCGHEENAQIYARDGAVPLLKAIEAHHDNAVFLGNAAMALSKLSVHPTAARPLVKRGAIAVIVNSANANADRKAIVARYLRTLANFLYTEVKAGDEVTRTNAYAILEHIVQKHSDFEPLTKEWTEFDKAVRLKSKKIGHTANHYVVPVRDKIDKTNLRLLTAGTVMRKYGDGKKGDASARKRLVRVDETCELLLFEDPNGKKGSKQLNMKSVQEIRNGNSHPGMKKVAKECGIEVISVDPNGRQYTIYLETKTGIEAEKWIAALQELSAACSSSEGSGPQGNANAGPGDFDEED